MQFRLLAAASLAAFTFAAAAQMPDKPITRPRITGISHIAVYTSNPAATDHYYREILGAAKLADPEDPKGVRYAVSATQFVEVLPLPADSGINRLDHTAWNTDDAEAHAQISWFQVVEGAIQGGKRRRRQPLVCCKRP